ncbi:MAG: hypothetical protein CVT62_06530 [Actinobacteria bacterium HGW-Actinobacteria-2]|nr:MAG: hypothetical protein CVT62_06530 [Actinobacteria bacterium HGW-Actinobacteria-2]
MQLPTTHPPKRGLVDRAALISLVGLAVLSVLGVGVVTIYLNRISTSADSMTRIGDMPDYVGRPEPVTAPGGGTVMNLLILVDQGGTLDSVVVANLSASRRSLTLITLPADLMVSGSGATLASTYAIDPTITVLAMEGLTGARMDHQLRLNLGCLSSVIDRAGGIHLSGSLMSGADAVRQTQSAPDPQANALGTARLIRSALISQEQHYSSLDPSRFAAMIDDVAPCAQVDNGVTSEVVQSTFFESSIHPDETRIWPLTTQQSGSELSATATSVDALRAALATPELSTTEQYQQAAFLPQEAMR